jgi:hypothetical protein
MNERDRGRLLANLKSLPNELDHLIGSLSDEDLRWHPIPNKWSIGEIVAHLRDAEREVFQVRLRRALYEDAPVYELWDQDRAAWERHYNDLDHRATAREFREARAETVAALDAVPLEFWDRTGVHPERGPETVEAMVSRQARNHDVSHLIQIKDIIRIKMPW